jgi:arsenate reductase
MTPPLRVLFLCTANSARSILAEALINDPRVGQGKFQGQSAGSHPRGDVQPLALAVLREQGFQTAGLRSKSWNEFAKEGTSSLDFVITVCDRAAAETCPIWPGHPMTAHWSVPDPAAVTGSEDDQRRAYREAMQILRRRIESFAALPTDKLSRLDLLERARSIGRL